MFPDRKLISLIIPIRLTATTFEAALRLERLMATVPADLFEIVIADYGTDDAHHGPLLKAQAAGARLVRHPAPEPLFSIGKARDFGVRMAGCPVIMFNDIDFLTTEQGYRNIHAHVLDQRIDRQRYAFFCVPVHFLTESGTATWLADFAHDRDRFVGLSIEDCETRGDEIQSTAFGSSAMVVNRDHYLSIGGHDPEFRGHGAEDYEFLHRLATLCPIAPWPHDYLRDTRLNSVRAYWGFRALYAIYGLTAFSAGLSMVHLHHPRRAERGYFRARANFAVLRKAVRRFDRTGRQPPALTSGLSRSQLVIRSDRPAEALDVCRQLIPLHGSVSVVKQWPQDLDAETNLVDLSGHGETSTARLVDPVNLATRTGTPLSGFFERLVGADGTIIDFGRPPERLAPDHPVFASFGGAGMLDKTLHPRPRTRAKSPWHIRLWRSITGR